MDSTPSRNFARNPVSDMTAPRPEDRSGFEIALFCALKEEAEAVIDCLDREDEQGSEYGKSPGDTNSYTTGAIGAHNVVVVHLAGMGPVEAASAAATVKISFQQIVLALVVGICGGVPEPTDRAPVFLGDQIISTAIVQYDFGRQYEEHFEPKRAVEDSLGRPNSEIRGLLKRLDVRQHRSTFLGAVNSNLIMLANKEAGFARPSDGHDVLFEPAYIHKHRSSGMELSCECAKAITSVCERARKAKCKDIGCESARSTTRAAAAQVSGPQLHLGRFGSGSGVIKSAAFRDTVAREDELVAFEMEGAGVWDHYPTIVVKAVCDYADSHKNKMWQMYAAGVAAASTKALLNLWTPRGAGTLPIRGVAGSSTNGKAESGLSNSMSRPVQILPLPRNRRYVDHGDHLAQVQAALLEQDGFRSLALVGLGGIGKTQIALEFAYRLQQSKPEYAILWVPAISTEGFEQALVQIAKRYNLSFAEDEDVRSVVKTHLSGESSGKWMMVVDNADDHQLVLGEQSSDACSIADFLPASRYGAILITTRSQEVAVSLQCDKTIDVDSMTSDEALALLRILSAAGRPSTSRSAADQAVEEELVQRLTCLPLAISQAAAYMATKRIKPSRYLELLHNTKEDEIRLLSVAMREGQRYKESDNAVATTWLVSFHQIEKSSAAAVELLLCMSFFEHKMIPRAILPPTSLESEFVDALGTLKSYAMISTNEDEDVFNMHRLVHLAAQVWREKRVDVEQLRDKVIRHVNKVHPSGEYEERMRWQTYLPHAILVLDDERDVDVAEVSHLAFQVGECLMADGRIKLALQYFRKCYVWRSVNLEEEHPSRLASQHALAGAYEADGQIGKAITMLEHVVAVEEKTLAEEHPSRLASQHALAGAYEADGQIGKAVKMLEHVVAVREKTLAEEHPSRLASQHALAGAYKADGQIGKAITMLEHVVAVREKTLAEEHPSRLVSQHALAGAYEADGQIGKAVKMLEHVVAVEEKTLAEEHPSRLASQHALAGAYEADGQIGKAAKMLEHVVAVEEKTLAEEHPDRLASQHALAGAYKADGQIGKAITMLEHVVAVREKTLAEEHPDRLASQHALAGAYEADGQIGKAVKMLEHVVAVEEKTLAEEHPDRLASQHALAGAYKADGQIGKAITMLEHVVAVREKTLAEEHPDRLASQHVLAGAYEADGQIGKAITMLEHVVRQKALKYRPQHPSRLRSEHLLRSMMQKKPDLK